MTDSHSDLLEKDRAFFEERRQRIISDLKRDVADPKALPSGFGTRSGRKYPTYLRGPHWQDMRRLALSAAWHRCQVCNSGEPLEVHHRTYERMGREELPDLVVLCTDCHGLFHKHGRMG